MTKKPLVLAIVVVSFILYAGYSRLSIDPFTRVFRNISTTPQIIRIAEVKPRDAKSNATIFYFNHQYNDIDNYGPELRLLASLGFVALAAVRESDALTCKEFITHATQYTDVGKAKLTCLVFGPSRSALEVSLKHLPHIRAVTQYQIVYCYPATETKQHAPSALQPDMEICLVDAETYRMEERRLDNINGNAHSFGRIRMRAGHVSSMEILQCLMSALADRHVVGNGRNLSSKKGPSQWTSILCVFAAILAVCLSVIMNNNVRLCLIKVVVPTAMTAICILGASVVIFSGTIYVLRSGGSERTAKDRPEVGEESLREDGRWLSLRHGVSVVGSKEVEQIIREACSAWRRFSPALSEDEYREYILSPMTQTDGAGLVYARTKMRQELLARMSGRSDVRYSQFIVGVYLRECFSIRNICGSDNRPVNAI